MCWFKSYLENRKQVVNVMGATSCSKDLRCGVPQGSVLGPILYVLYTSPLGDIVRSHGLSRHFYADDTVSSTAHLGFMIKWLQYK